MSVTGYSVNHASSVYKFVHIGNARGGAEVGAPSLSHRGIVAFFSY